VVAAAAAPATGSLASLPPITARPGEFNDSFEVASAQGSAQNEVVSDHGIGDRMSSVQDSGAGLTAMTSPIGFHVSLAVKERIWRGEFIDFSLLLGSNNGDQNVNQLRGLSISAGGALTLAPQSQRKIVTIEQWTDAFLVFMAIYTLRHPEKSQELIKYLTVIREAARKFSGSGWSEYDQHFRMRQAAMPHRSWSILDGELWYLILVPSAQAAQQRHQVLNERGSFRTGRGGGAFRASADDSLPRGGMSGRSSGRPAFQPIGRCYSYNRASGCSAVNCRYRHVCLRCGQPHPMAQCGAAN
jgi:hypothetical protein